MEGHVHIDKTCTIRLNITQHVIKHVFTINKLIIVEISPLKSGWLFHSSKNHEI